MLSFFSGPFPPLNIRFPFSPNIPFFPRFRPFLNDPREDCRNLTEISENFCAKPENTERFRYRRSISGICNNLSPGKGAVGAADTQVARLARKY